MTPLFVTDLDGTILDENARLPKPTEDKLNALIKSGALITFATARSRESASEILSGVHYRLPIIAYNGAACYYRGKSTHEVLFSEAELKLFKRLFKNTNFLSFDFDGESVVVKYAPCDCPVNSYAFNNMSKAGKKFVEVSEFSDFFSGACFHLLAIENEREKLAELLTMLQGKTQVGLFKDLYLKNYWLELMPKACDKGVAATRLLDECGADCIISFGDGYNDIPLFRSSRFCYAVDNADDNLKSIATEVLAQSVTVPDKIAEIIKSI